MVKRTLSNKVLEHSKKYPVVAVTGPRQSGKTTLVKACFPEFDYVSLEDFDIRYFAEQDPRGFLAKYSNGAILDEIQRVPHLLSYIQTIVDKEQKNGLFILTGSNQFTLMKEISQTLAGRISLLKLFPFTLDEINNTEFYPRDYHSYIFNGSYPRIYDQHLNPREWYADYIETYIEKDLKEISNIVNLSLFRKFLSLLASSCGQLVNLSSFSNSIGVSQNTIKSWIALLEQSYIIFTLQPYFKNFHKRIVKTPKVYFYDTGLACMLLRFTSPQSLHNHFMTGHLFENMIISELYKSLFHLNIKETLYFWRDHTGHEIDCLMESNTQLYPVEIKSAATINSDFFKELSFFNTLSGAPPTNSTLIYGGNEKRAQFSINVLGWQNVDENIKNIFNFIYS